MLKECVCEYERENAESWLKPGHVIISNRPLQSIATNTIKFLGLTIQVPKYPVRTKSELMGDYTSKISKFLLKKEGFPVGAVAVSTTLPMLRLLAMDVLVCDAIPLISSQTFEGTPNF